MVSGYYRILREAGSNELDIGSVLGHMFDGVWSAWFDCDRHVGSLGLVPYSGNDLMAWLGCMMWVDHYSGNATGVS